MGSVASALMIEFLFLPVFQGTRLIDPVALHFGPLTIRWYGFILAFAIGIAYEWSRRRLLRRGVDPLVTETIVWWAAIGGLLGARLGFVVQNSGYFAAHTGEVLALAQGGLSIHGAVIGGATAVWLVAHQIKRPFLLLADAIAPTVLLGAIIGRFGNFMNYELYGYPATVVWKMFVPLGYRLPGYEQFSFFHPTFLYEALLNLVMLAIVLRYEQAASSKQQIAVAAKSRSPFAARSLPAGSIFFLTLTLYSISRFIVEFFRIGAPIGWHLTLAQWVSLAIIGISGIVLTRLHRKSYNFIKK